TSSRLSGAEASSKLVSDIVIRLTTNLTKMSTMMSGAKCTPIEFQDWKRCADSNTYRTGCEGSIGKHTSLWRRARRTRLARLGFGQSSRLYVRTRAQGGR